MVRFHREAMSKILGDSQKPDVLLGNPPSPLHCRATANTLELKPEMEPLSSLLPGPENESFHLSSILSASNFLPVGSTPQTACLPNRHSRKEAIK